MVDTNIRKIQSAALGQVPENSGFLSFIKKGCFVLAAAVFWMWQIAFIVLSLFTLVPEYLPLMWEDYRYFGMPLHYFLVTVAVVVLPIICLVFIAWLLRFDKPKRVPAILKFFYGFELPILLLLGLYLANLRDYGVGLYWLLISALIALTMWMFLIVAERRLRPNSVVSVVMAKSPVVMAGSTVLFAMGMFASISLLLFVVPMLVFFVIGIFELFEQIDWTVFSPSSIWNYVTNISWSMVFTGFEVLVMVPLLAGGILILTSLLLLAVMPFALIYLYVGQFIQRLRHSPSAIKVMTAALVLMVLVGVHFYANQQPQQAVFALLESEENSESERTDLVNRSDEIKSALLNAYLARYRYFSSTGSASVLTELYTDGLGLDKRWGDYAQKTLNALLMPILYDGDNRRDALRAEKHYERFFDAPIQKAEVDEIWRTLDFNMKRSAQNAAGLLDVNQKSVHMKSQSIDVDVKDQMATITVIQQLVNHSERLQEAVIHFSLPEHAAITGVWLSDTESNLRKHAYLVSPRGAAQTVYKEQVNRRIDPALLEKVGPELYRLRVYPILAGSLSRVKGNYEGEPMYATFEYQALVNKNGEWPVPRVLEQRQVYWDANTQRSIDGQPIIPVENSDWVPRELGATNATVAKPFKLLVADNLSTWALPVTSLTDKSKEQVANSKAVSSRFVVLIDGSRSMHSYRNQLAQTIEQLAGARLLFCQQICNDISVDQVDDLVYWGNSKPIEQLHAFTNSIDGNAIDNMIMITDDGSYEAEGNNQQSITTQSPVWVLHLDGKQPYAYSDAWLTTVNRSGGGFSHQGISNLLMRIATTKLADELQFEHFGFADKAETLTVTNVNNDWIWVDEAAALSSLSSTTYEKLSAAYQIARATKTNDTLALEQLDLLHNLAARAGIVTELSSMIVLVNDAQRDALKEAEKQDDRFERENEDGQQTVGIPNDSLAVAAVPEPREWAMMLIVLSLLTFSIYQRRNTRLVGQLRC